VAELTKTHGEDNREFLGRMVRLAWMEWAKEQHDPKPSWLVPWGQMSERMKEVDRRIGERIASVALPLWVDDRAEVERLRERAELAEKSRDAFKKVACENAALLRTLNGVPWQGDEDHIAALAVRLRAENERLRKRLAGECETCGGSGLMDAFSGYGERGEEITEQATCAECQGSGFGWMADTVKERDRLRSLMREMHRTVLAQSAREAELRGSQKAALDDILASIDDARRISPEWPAALWQGFNRIDAGVRAARKRVEPRDGEEGPEPMTPEQIHAKVVEGNEDARETVERLRELLRVARALRHECARHDAAVAPGVRVGGPRFPPSTRRLLQPLCDAVDALGGGEED
jgi:hypothetical protein